MFKDVFTTIKTRERETNNRRILNPLVRMVAHFLKFKIIYSFQTVNLNEKVHVHFLDLQNGEGKFRQD